MDKHTLEIITWIKRLPKTEIHLHSEAIVSFNSYMQLNNKYGIDPSLRTLEDYKQSINFKNLSDMITHFLYLQSFFREEEDYAFMCTDILNYARENNIFYMEIFFSPSKILELGYVDFFKVLDILSKSFDRIQREHNIDIRVIIDVSRSFGPENAMNNLQLLLRYLEGAAQTRFIGIGLGGAEAGNNCVDYKEVFDRARKAKLHLVAHAGEEVDSASIWNAIKLLRVERIGHGTSAVFDPKLMLYIKNHKIPLEICPTSNIITRKYVQTIADHPIRQFFDAGLFVTVNTDDPLLFNVNLNKEYYKLYKFLHFGKKELLQLVKNGIYASFMPTREKHRHWKRVAGSASKLS